MPDTAILRTIALVRTAKIAVSNAQSDSTITGTQQTQLVTLLWQLNDLESALILNDIQAQVGKLTADAAALKTVTTQLQASIASLQAVANAVGAAANAIGVLVNIAQSAASLGIVA